MTLVARTTVEVTVELLQYMNESDCWRQARDEIYAAYPPPTTLEFIDTDWTEHDNGHMTYRWSVA